MKEKEWEDPIVAEVRATRDAYAKKFNYDLDAMFEDLLQRQEDHKKQGYQYITLPSKKKEKLTGTHS